MRFASELSNHVPRYFLELGDKANRTTLLGLGLCVFGGLCFGLAGFSSVFVRFLPPIVGPLISALFFSLIPLNPYRGLFAEREGWDTEKLANDRIAQKLLLLLRSASARKVCLQCGAATAILLGSLTLAFSILRGTATSIGVDHYPAIVFALLFVLLTINAHISVLMSWAIRTWGNA